MRITLLAPLAVMLLACQPPGAPEDEPMLERAWPASGTVHTRIIEDADDASDGESPGDPTASESDDDVGC